MEILDSVNNALNDGVSLYVGMTNDQYIYLAIALFVGIFLAIVAGGIVVKLIGVK